MNNQAVSRSFSGTSTPYEKLTLRLTPTIHDQRGIIRISAKNTPSSNTDASNPILNNRVTRHEWGNQSMPSKVSTHIQGLSTVKDYNLVTGAKLIRSEVTSSSRNWEAECVSLKQTVDYYKSRVVELQSGTHEKNPVRYSDKGECQSHKLKLQEMQQRMGEENAFLRECMISLNDQLQQTKRLIPAMKGDLQTMQDINHHMSQELAQKNKRLSQCEEAHQRLVALIQQQKTMGEKVNDRLIQLEDNIQFLVTDNERLVGEVEDAGAAILTLDQTIEEEKAKNRSVLRDCLMMQREIQSHKQHISQLQTSLSKERQDNLKRKKTIDDEPSKGLLLTKSDCFIDSLSESEPNRLRGSDSFITHNRSSCRNEIGFSKSYSTVVFQQSAESPEFQLFEYQQKTEQLRALKMHAKLQKTVVPEACSKALGLADFFCTSVKALLTERSRLQQLTQKYKRLVELSWQGPTQEQIKPVEFITDLIQKCNLYESSIYQKRSTIDALQSEIHSLKEEPKLCSNGDRPRHSHRDDQIQKQKVIITRLEKHVDQLNLKISQNGSVEKNQRSTSVSALANPINALHKIKGFRPGGLSPKKDMAGHAKLKNISGEEIIKQMEGKLRFYQGEVVPELQAKITEYQGMINSFQRTISHSVVLEDSVMESEVRLRTSSGQSNINGSILRKRNDSNSVRFRGFKVSGVDLLGESKATEAQISNPNVGRQKKRRLDQIVPESNQKILASLALRLCEIAQKMVRNNNFTVILPDSVYLFDCSEEYLGSMKLKILGTPSSKSVQAKNYWAPENLRGAPFGEPSLVWNIALLLDQTIHGQLFFKAQDEILDQSIDYQFLTPNRPFLQNLLSMMLQKDSSRRIRLKEIQTRILEQQLVLFN